VIVPLAALLAVLWVRLVGGRLGRFATIRLRSAELAAAGFWVQLAGLEVLTGPHALLVVLHLGSYLAAAAFVLINRRLPGIWLVGLGGLANGVTVALNGGTLPAASAALARAGMPATTAGYANSGLVAHPRMAMLGDVFAVPASWPLSNVFSVGDVLVVAGCGWASVRICGTRWTAPWNARAAGHARGRHLAGLVTGVVSPDGRPGRRPAQPDPTQPDPTQRRPRPGPRGAGRRVVRTGRVFRQLVREFGGHVARQLVRRFGGAGARHVAAR
jgi:hypothetical protein